MRLLLDLDSCGGTAPLGLFPLFLKRTADVLAPRLSAVFRRQVRLGNFPACWRQANVTPKLKGVSYCSVANYLPISTKSALFKVFQCLLSVEYRKIYGTQWCASNDPVCLSDWYGSLICIFMRVLYTSKYIGEWAGDTRIVQIDFSAAFNMVNHQGILY